ncbi:hypothetical protein ABEB36_004656 [Hypothenemus hampei]|uniref:Uncharacterized protein n=1 Tax=Hypothenemus hampei TaxID=57062 RepID=A0ABD1F6P3_HYPHA
MVEIAFKTMSSSEEFEEECVEVAAAVAVLEYSKRKLWIDSINKNRKVEGEFSTLFSELKKEENEEKFFMYFRMNKDQFYYLHDLIKEKIFKQNTKILIEKVLQLKRDWQFV